MNRIEKLFAEKQNDILNIYFTAGYPTLDSTPTVIKSLTAAGVDLIEVGMPYSDPLADGPTIQESGMAALKNGMTLEILFDQLQQVRKECEVPLVMMGYFNQMMQYGEERFLEACKAAEIDALILPDLPMDVYEREYKSLFEQYQIPIVFLITPQTSEDRIRKIDELSNGFIYMVSNNSITGAKSGISEMQMDYFNRINAMQLRNPRLIGFGISNYATYRTACDYSNGAIIGSAFIKTIGKATQLEQSIHEFVQMVRGELTVSS
ncbi:MAG: tryptophan synthase subunit alpha [Bacteroidota bacterium]